MRVPHISRRCGLAGCSRALPRTGWPTLSQPHRERVGSGPPRRRHPERSSSRITRATQSKDPEAPHPTPAARTILAKTPKETPALVVTFAFLVAIPEGNLPSQPLALLPLIVFVLQRHRRALYQPGVKRSETPGACPPNRPSAEGATHSCPRSWREVRLTVRIVAQIGRRSQGHSLNSIAVVLTRKLRILISFGFAIRTAERPRSNYDFTTSKFQKGKRDSM